ncbi:baseplate J/gp47 family protein [Pantoea septica]|uniref:baseplate J/gp47 family protein n=1 Tax=Pantoea septica TaxID=472695 RepID=UPI0023F714B8|nr:baseplate J/gp47 family protein [Pantoea septica]
MSTTTTTPTKDSIQEEFESLIESNTYWSKFVGSQFVSMLVTFITQMVYRCYQYADAALAEGFISTASRRASILAAAETVGYVGTKPTPSTGQATITLSDTDIVVSVPRYTTLISDDQYSYLTMEEAEFGTDGTATVAVSQLEIQEVTATVSSATEFLEVVLSKDLTATCYKLEVFVTTNGTKTQWTKSTMFRLATSSSKVYVEFYKPSEQLGVRFGDGTIGMLPPAGSTITLKVWCTSGDVTLVSGQALTPVDDYADLASSVTITSSGSITNGTDAEATEITRNRAQYYLAYDNQVVWAADYAFYLLQNISGMSWCKVWGEAEQEVLDGEMKVANINNIFISGWYPGKTQSELQSLVLAALDDVPNELNKTFTYTAVSELPFTITLTGTISASLTKATVLSELKSYLTTRFGKDSTYFDPDSVGDYVLIKQKDLWAYIESLGYFEDFSLTFNDWRDSNGYNEFVYLDVGGSSYAISYEDS